MLPCEAGRTDAAIAEDSLSCWDWDISRTFHLTHALAIKIGSLVCQHGAE